MPALCSKQNHGSIMFMAAAIRKHALLISFTNEFHIDEGVHFNKNYAVNQGFAI